MQRYAVWFGGSMLASTVSHTLNVYWINLTPYSLNFMKYVIQREITMSMVQAFVDIIQFLEQCLEITILCFFQLLI